MRAFVLSTGRCGSTTFAKACEYMSNFTSGHETRWGLHGPERFAFADNHVEVDNRLSWHLGELGHRYPDALFVHLKRDPNAVALSYSRRWYRDPPYRYRSMPRGLRRITRRAEMLRASSSDGIIEAYAYSILGREEEPWPEVERIEVCHAYVETVNRNIEQFLDGRDGLSVDLESARHDFPLVWNRLQAQGDLDAALAEFGNVHNASKAPG